MPQNNTETVELAEVLNHKNEFITIDDWTTYKRVTARLHVKGIVLRDEVEGLQIKTKKQQLCKARDLLVAEIDAKVGGYGILPPALEGAIVSSHYFLFEVDKKKLDPGYLNYFIKTKAFQQQIAARGSTNYASIRPVEVLQIKMPLPSLNKQSQVIIQLDRLLGNIDSVREVQNHQEMEMLWKSILRKAFEGKLVRQDPHDEPAIELLAKIKEDYQKQKQQRNRGLPALDVSVLPALPGSWTWAYLGDVARVMDIDHKMPTSAEEGVLFISPKDFVTDGINLENAKRITREDFERISRKCKPELGDIIYSRIGAKLGRARKVPLDVEFHISYSLCLVRPHDLLRSNDFLYWLMRSPFILNQARAKIQSIGVPDLGLGEINKFLVPLAPLNEQHRIASAIEQLYAKVQETNRLRAGVKEGADRLVPSLLNAVFKGQIKNKRQNLQTSFQSSLQI
jgi:type I restriction enzyme S subunit